MKKHQILSAFNRNTRLHCLTLIIQLLWLAMSYSQSIIALQNFENTGSNYNYTNTNGVLQTGNSSSTDKPANIAFYVSNNTGFRTSNQTSVLNFDNITGLGMYRNKKIAIRLAAFSISSASNGMDATDKVTISISLNGGSSFSDELSIKGNSNAQWHYTTGTGIASVNYDGNNSVTEFAPAGGGNRTIDGYSVLNINLPDSCSQCKLKITAIDDSNNEAWLIDDVLMTGCIPVTYVTCPSNTTIRTDPGLCTGIFNYNVLTSGLPTPEFSYHFSGATTGNGTGSGTGAAFTKGITTINVTAGNTCGSSSCSFTVTVRDFEVPAISCPQSVNYILNNGGCSPVTSISANLISLGMPLVTDNCSVTPSGLKK
jgi:hypothetical protein